MSVFEIFFVLLLARNWAGWRGMTLEASRRERHAVASQTELEGSLYGLRPSRDAAQPDAARGLGSLMGGGRATSRSSSANGSYQQRVVIVRVHRATMHGGGARALLACVRAEDCFWEHRGHADKHCRTSKSDA